MPFNNNKKWLKDFKRFSKAKPLKPQVIAENNSIRSKIIF